MSLAPEFQLLAINAVILAVAYGGIYPSMRGLTMGRMLGADALLSALALVTAGALFWGTETRFSLLLFETNWLVFTFLTMLVMEYPLFSWFCRKHGLRFGPEADGSDGTDPR